LLDISDKQGELLMPGSVFDLIHPFHGSGTECVSPQAIDRIGWEGNHSTLLQDLNSFLDFSL
jgi:hypothetical protein